MELSSGVVKIRNSYIHNDKIKDEIKILSVGDIHISSLVDMDDIDKISSLIYQEEPNYICLLGDLVDTPLELEKNNKVKELITLVKNASSIAPTLIILGSHDFIDESVEEYPDIIDKTTIWNDIDKMTNSYILNDKIYEDKKIFIGGYRQKKEAYYNYNSKEDSIAYYNDFSNYKELYKDIPIDKATILLTHSPEPIKDINVQNLIKDYDIILTGHYHNGCVPAIIDQIYPKNSGIITPRKKLLPKQARGIVKLDMGTYLIYNGGWVKIQECAPKILQPLDKLCHRQMEVTVLTPDEDVKDIEIKNKKKVLKRI